MLETGKVLEKNEDRHKTVLRQLPESQLVQEDPEKG